MSDASPTRIIDAHHHIWLRKDLAWLSGPIQPRIFGNYEPIRRDYTIEDFRADLAGTPVEKSVYVQANWPNDRFEDEVAWVQRCSEESGWVMGIVGYADFLVDDIRPQLDRLTRYSLMRGVRMQLHWHETELYRFASRPDLCLEPTVRRNIAALANYGWTFDLQVFPGQMAGAADLAAATPGVTFILQHAGMQVDHSDAGWAAWREGMTLLAAQPNIVSKLSAFGTFLRRLDRDFIARMVRETVAMFGASRCMYGSNYPIEKIWTEYRPLLDAHLAATAHLPAKDQADIFWNTAERVYRLG